MSEQFFEPSGKDYRRVGSYMLRGKGIIGTPMGDVPATELSALFYTQIAPLDYFPVVNRADDAVDVSITAYRTLHIRGQELEIGSDNALFALNALLALRTEPAVRVEDAYALGMTRFDTASLKAQSAWSKSIGQLINRVNSAADTPLLEKTTINSRTMHYRVSPKVHLVDERPTDPSSPEYLRQALTSRFLALQETNRLLVPYAPGRSLQRFAITTNRQIERGGQAWILTDNERHLLNLIRLTAGGPLLAGEILGAGFSAKNNTDKARRDAIRNTVASLNDSIFAGDDRLRALVIDASDTMLVRLTRNIIVQDSRSLRTPTDRGGNDRELASTFRSVQIDYQDASAARRTRQAAELIQAIPPTASVIALVNKRAPTAFLKQQIGLRDMYLLCLRTGLDVPFLADTVLPRTDGVRVGYNAIRPLIRKGPQSRAQIADILGMNPTVLAPIVNKAIRILQSATEGR